MKIDNKKSFCFTILITIIVLVIVLYAGLRPKSWPLYNDAKLITQNNVLRFQGDGIAYIDDLETCYANKNLKEFTIHLSVTANNIDKLGFRPILMIHDGRDSQQLAAWQWGASVIVMNGDDYSYTRKRPRIYTKNALKSGIKCFITITSGSSGTRIFLNGQSAILNKKLRLTIPDDGKKSRIILGNSVYGKHGWKGEINGLAFYAKAFSTEEVKYLSETSLLKPEFQYEDSADLMVLLSFEDENPQLTLDSTCGNTFLLIPQRLTVLQKTFLTTPWSNLKLNRVFGDDAIINLVGFVPLAICVYFLLCQSKLLHQRYAILATVLLCFLLSLSIEMLQALLPYRNSSWLDLILNTLGAAVGAVVSQVFMLIKIDNFLKRS